MYQDSKFVEGPVKESPSKKTPPVTPSKGITTRRQVKEPSVRLVFHDDPGPGNVMHSLVKKKLPSFVMNHVDKLPVGAIYNYTPRNCLVEDEKALPNIPYIDDVTASENNPFIREVISCYTRIHSEAMIKDDNIFISIISRLANDEPVKSEEDEDEDSGIETAQLDQVDQINHQLLSLAFEAVSKAFPDEGTHEDVSVRFQRLTQNKAASSFNPNIDGSAAQSVKRERSINSFKILFCRRCLMYDCFLHSREMDLTQEVAAQIKIRRREDFIEFTPVDKKSCSKTCYRILRLSSKSKVKQEKPTVKLSPAEESLIRCEWISSPANFCFLRELINNESVTCTMIYDWCKDNFDNFDIMMSAELNGVSGTQNGTQTMTSMSKVSQTKPEGMEDENSCNSMNSDSNGLCDNDQGDDVSESVASSSNNDKRKKKTKTANPKMKKSKKNLYSVWQKNASAFTHGSSSSFGRNDTQIKGLHSCNYTPCLDHPGEECSKANNCHCLTQGHFCEKYCLCSNDCRFRFPGCRCSGVCNTKACPCYASSRECDPDLCVPCGAGDIPEPKKCSNVDLQRMHKKHLLVAPSALGPDAGWGCFIKDKCSKNDLISEYVGEVISQAEADRRGLIYDKKKHSFLFCLNNEFSVDATRKGNKIRFANHSVNPNCFAKIMKVNGEHRIGIYAKRDIEAKEELFFDYKYGPNERIEFVPIEQNQPQTKRIDNKPKSGGGRKSASNTTQNSSNCNFG